MNKLLIFGIGAAAVGGLLYYTKSNAAPATTNILTPAPSYNSGLGSQVQSSSIEQSGVSYVGANSGYNAMDLISVGNEQQIKLTDLQNKNSQAVGLQSLASKLSSELIRAVPSNNTTGGAATANLNLSVAANDGSKFDINGAIVKQLPFSYAPPTQNIIVTPQPINNYNGQTNVLGQNANYFSSVATTNTTVTSTNINKNMSLFG